MNKIDNVNLDLNKLNKGCNLIRKIMNNKLQWNKVETSFKVFDNLENEKTELTVIAYDNKDNAYDLDVFVANHNLLGNIDYLSLLNIFKDLFKTSNDGWNVLEFTFNLHGDYHLDAYYDDNLNTNVNSELTEDSFDLITEVQQDVDLVEAEDQAVELLEEIPEETYDFTKDDSALSETEIVKQKVETVLNNTISYFQLLELIRNKIVPYKINCLGKNYIFDGITYVEENVEPFAISLLQNLLKEKSIGEEALTNLRMIKIVEWEYDSKAPITDTLFMNDILSS